MDIFKKLENESIEEYVLRLSDEKTMDKSITWQRIADALVKEFRIIRSEAWVRKLVKSSMELVEGETIIDDIVNAKQELQDKILELKKEKIKIADERNQNKSYIRKLARVETYKEIALEVVKEISKTKMLPKQLPLENIVGDKEAILCIGDWHYGIDFKNPWNEFNPEVCRERVNELKTKAIQHIKTHKCNKELLSLIAVLNLHTTSILYFCLKIVIRDSCSNLKHSL